MGQRRLHRGRATPGIVLVSLTLLAGMCAGVAVGAEGDAPGPSITATGRAEVAVPPDIVRISFAVESMAPTAASAAEDNRARADRLIGVMKGLTADGGSVSTSGFWLIPVYDTEEQGTGRQGGKALVGYRAHNEVIVELRDLASAGAVIDAGIGAGADRVANVRFDIADRGAAMRQAVMAAGRDARAQAEAVAQAMGVTLGGLRSASTSPDPVRLPQGRVFAAAASRTQTPIEPGQVKVSASVHATYDIAK